MQTISSSDRRSIPTVAPAASDALADQRAYRLTAIDMVRGLVIVIMAIDHVRDYFMVAADRDPMADPDMRSACSRRAGSPTSVRQCSCCSPV